MKPYRADLLQRPTQAELLTRRLHLRPAARTSIDDPVNLKQQFALLWRDRTLIAAVTLTSTLLTTGIAFLLPTEYQATILLQPVLRRSDESGSFGSLGSEMGGLAQLAGLGSSGEAAKYEALAVLQSAVLTEKYIAQNNLLSILYPTKWNRRRQAWKTNDPRGVPTLWKANRYFNKAIRKVTTSATTGLVSMTITWTDPVLAAQWANGLVRMTNDYMRSEAIAEAQRNIAYLNSEIARTSLVEARQAIVSVLRDEITQEMLARGNEEYAFKVLDPAQAPEQASSPVKTLWLAGGLAAGLFFGITFSFLRAAWREAP